MTPATRMSAAEYLAAQAAPRRSKYGNVRTELDGITFDSKAEASFYALLLLREKAGEVSNIRHQVGYDLKGENGQVVTVYVADFVFFDNGLGRERVVDVKGGKATQTALFQLKKRFMQANHGITVECLTASGDPA